MCMRGSAEGRGKRVATAIPRLLPIRLFVGPKEEAEEIKHRLRSFLQEELNLKLSEAKTLITHAKTETARFLNYEIHTIQENAHRDQKDRRTLNGTIGLRVPREVIKNKCQSYKRYSRKVQHRTELINDSDFSIMALYQAEYRQNTVDWWNTIGSPTTSTASPNWKGQWKFPSPRHWPPSTGYQCRRCTRNTRPTSKKAKSTTSYCKW